MKKLISVVLSLAMIMSLAAGVVAYEAPAGIDSLAIVGSGIPGVSEWNPADPAGDMELVDDNIYYKEVTLSAGQSMTFKIAGNDCWDDTCNFGTNGPQTLELDYLYEMICSGGSSNMTFVAEYDMTIGIVVSLYDFAMGGAPYIMIYEVVEFEEIILQEETTATLESAYDNVTYEVTPDQDGYLVFYLSGNPGWRIMDYFDFDFFYSDEDGSVLYMVYAGVSYDFALGCYDVFEDEYAPGDLTYSVSLIPADLGGFEEDEEVEQVQNISLSCDDYAEFIMPVGGVMNVEIDCTEYAAIFYVDGGYDIENGNFYSDWFVTNGVLSGMPNDLGSYSIELAAGQVYNFSIYATDEAVGNQSMFVATEAAIPGSANSPYDLVMGQNVGSFDEWESVFFDWTAAEDGVLTLTALSDLSPDWAYYVIVEPVAGDPYYSETLYSDDVFCDGILYIEVSAGDYVLVVACDPNFAAGTVYLDAEFTASESGGGDIGGGDEPGGDIEMGDGDIVINNEVSKADEPWTYTFEIDGPGGLHVVIGDCTPGWRYKIEYPNGETSLYFSASAWSVGPDYTHELTEAGQYKVMIWAYDAANYTDVNGTVSASITFTPAGDDVEVPKEEYIVSDILLGLGENELTLDENAITTIYEFCPDEIGLYKFTVDGESALIGYWGAGSFFVWDQTENKTNVLEKELDAVGQSIMVGVSGVEGSFNMTIEKIGEAEEIVQIQYNDYTVKHVPLDQYLIDTDGKVVTPVDITKSQNVVKGSDGFYHLGTANGPVIYVNLTNEVFDILQAFFGGYGAMTMRGKYTDDNGVDYYYDFLNAMRIYATVLYDSDYDNGLYPLTEDLKIFMLAFGGYQGWYNAEQTGFEAIKEDHNPESAWLVSCVTVTTPSDYRVTGNADWLGNWAADNEAGVMMDLGNGSYQITYSDVPAGDYELKVTKGGSWDENWGSNGENVKFTVGEGQSVTITFNAETGTITISLSGGDSNPPSGDYSVAALVVAMMAAAAGAVVLAKKKED